MFVDDILQSGDFEAYIKNWLAGPEGQALVPTREEAEATFQSSLNASGLSLPKLAEPKAKTWGTGLEHDLTDAKRYYLSVDLLSQLSKLPIQEPPRCPFDNLWVEFNGTLEFKSPGTLFVTIPSEVRDAEDEKEFPLFPTAFDPSAYEWRGTSKDRRKHG